MGITQYVGSCARAKVYGSQHVSQNYLYRERAPGVIVRRLFNVSATRAVSETFPLTRRAVGRHAAVGGAVFEKPWKLQLHNEPAVLRKSGTARFHLFAFYRNTEATEG